VPVEVYGRKGDGGWKYERSNFHQNLNGPFPLVTYYNKHKNTALKAFIK
jgi:hypothetical protein